MWKKQAGEKITSSTNGIVEKMDVHMQKEIRPVSITLYWLHMVRTHKCETQNTETAREIKGGALQDTGIRKVFLNRTSFAQELNLISRTL